MRHTLTLALLLAFVSAFGQEGKDTTRRTIYDIPRQGVILTLDYVWSLTAGYQYIKPLNNFTASYSRIGVGFTGESGMELTINGDQSLLFGKRNHFGELGVGFWGPISDNSGLAFFPNLSYRYMPSWGLHFKLGMGMSIYTAQEDKDNAWEGQYGLWPVIQLGYIYHF